MAVIGFSTITQLKELQAYLSFVGQLTFEAIRLIFHPAHWRWNSLASVLYRTGYQALPIIALLSFLIGCCFNVPNGIAVA